MATKVLVVDDDPGIRLLVRMFLESGDAFDVVGEAGSCAEAMELAEVLEPDLVTMDHAMPGHSGTECIREMKTRWPAVLILAVTGSDSETAQEMVDAGAYASVDKAHLQALMPALYQVANRRTGDRRASSGQMPADPTGQDELRQQIATLEAGAAAGLEQQKRDLAARVEGVVALRAVVAAARNPKYSPAEALDIIHSLACELLHIEQD